MSELKFVNSDAKPKVSTVRCNRASMGQIMAWYGGFFAGDRYAGRIARTVGAVVRFRRNR